MCQGCRFDLCRAHTRINQPWLVWLSGWSTGLGTKRLPVWFCQGTCLGCRPGPQLATNWFLSHINVSLPVFSLPSSLSENKSFFKKRESTNECINKWNNKLMFLALPSFLKWINKNVKKQNKTLQKTKNMASGTKRPELKPQPGYINDVTTNWVTWPGHINSLVVLLQEIFCCFYFEIILNVEKSCKNSTKNPYIPFTKIHRFLTFHQFAF